MTMDASHLFAPLTITDGGTQELLLVTAGFLLGLGIIYWGFKTYRTGQLIKNTPTEKTRAVAIGRTELRGTCRDAGTTFDQPFSEGRCVYREWKVEEYKEDHSDDDNNTKEWKTHSSGSDAAAFYLEDEAGKILVDATDDASFQISDANTEKITVGRGSSLPTRVESFYQQDEQDQRQQAEQLADAMPGSMFGNVFGGQGMPGNVDTEEADGDPRHIYQQYLPDEMLDEDGYPREDLSDEEVERIMRERAQEQRSQSDATDGESWPGESDDDRDGSGGQRSGPGSAPGQPAGRNDDSSALDKAKSLFGSVSDTVSTLSSMGGNSRPSQRYKRRFTQKVLPVDEEVYVFGGAYQQDHASGSNVERLVIRTDEGTDRFIVSDRDEESLAKHYTIWAPLYMLVGLLLSAGTLYILLNDWLLL